MDKTPLSFRIDFTRRLGRRSIDPILISRIRRGADGVGVSVVERFIDYLLNNNIHDVTIFDVVLFNDRDDDERATERHRYSAANHFSISATGGRNVTSWRLDKSLITKTVRPSSSCTLSTRHPRKSEIIR